MMEAFMNVMAMIGIMTTVCTMLAIIYIGIDTFYERVMVPRWEKEWHRKRAAEQEEREKRLAAEREE